MNREQCINVIATCDELAVQALAAGDVDRARTWVADRARYRDAMLNPAEQNAYIEAVLS